MKRTLFTTIACAATLAFTGAQAASITNNEQVPQTFKVYAGDKQEEYTLAPNDTIGVEDICSTDCVVELSNGDEYEVVRGDKLYLEDGAMFSNPAQGSKPDAESAPQQQ